MNSNPQKTIFEVSSNRPQVVKVEASTVKFRQCQNDTNVEDNVQPSAGAAGVRRGLRNRVIAC